MSKEGARQVSLYWVHDERTQSKNIFDNIPALAPPKLPKVSNELDAYLAASVEAVEDPLLWWHEHCAVYPNLSRMAASYLSIPG